MMDSNRSAKRRKLEALKYDSQRSSPASHSRETPITDPKKRPKGFGDQAAASRLTTTANGGTTPSPAHLAWQEAKAKSKALSDKKVASNGGAPEEIDVYDDFEGAHRERDPPKIKSTTSTPVKQQLDPLRNQKASVATIASPSRPGAGLGFFKQFTKPKSESQRLAAKLDAAAGKQGNGVPIHHSQDKEEDASAAAGAEEEVEHLNDGEDSIAEPDSKATGRGVWKGWAYDTGRKKTLEDEIRELGNVAREQAEEDEDGGPAATASSSRRKRNRVSKFGTGDDSRVASNGQKAARSSTADQRQAIGKLTKAKDIPPPSADAGVVVQDEMEIDEPSGDQADLAKPMPSIPHRLQEEALTKPKPQQRSKPVSSSATATFSPEHLQQIQTILLEKLTRKRRTRISNLESEHSKVSNVITQTITAGESNSMLLIGARGSGKSALVDQIMHEQTRRHQDDFHVVRLNGFIHTDDKIALREIWRQLGREMELDGDESTSKNYADTLTTLLALLSHPAEMGQEQEAGQITKSVVFVLDEFELFASHPRQTLLYNLFDIAQSRKAPIAVLGLTTRIDVAESLEKRVKSRFSHRYVHLGFAKSFTMFQEACKTAIGLHYDELSGEERQALGARNEVTENLSKESKKDSNSVFADWNTLIDALLQDEIFTTNLRRIFYTTKSTPEFNASMLMPVATLPTDASTTTSGILAHVTKTLSTSSLVPPDSNLTLLHSLSTLHLALLICAARITNIHATDVVPFAQAYEEYKVLASKQKLQASASGALAQGAGSRVWSKDVAQGAWEDLIAFGLAIEDGTKGVRVDVGLEEIGMSGVELGSWGRWCREV